jgi:hypothetical protein
MLAQELKSFSSLLTLRFISFPHRLFQNFLVPPLHFNFPLFNPSALLKVNGCNYVDLILICHIHHIQLTPHF